LEATEICERIRKRAGSSRVICRLFENQPWRSKTEALSASGLSDAHWFEVSPVDAKGLVAAALAHGLCYGERRMPDETAERLVSEFLKLLHPQTRYFTNSSVPYHKREAGFWSFNPIWGERTLDTGIICKTGKRLSGVLWVGDID
jgi:hypothetical protein